MPNTGALTVLDNSWAFVLSLATLPDEPLFIILYICVCVNLATMIESLKSQDNPISTNKITKLYNSVTYVQFCNLWYALFVMYPNRTCVTARCTCIIASPTLTQTWSWPRIWTLENSARLTRRSGANSSPPPPPSRKWPVDKENHTPPCYDQNAHQYHTDIPEVNCEYRLLY